MKLGLISDIHGNLPALEAALEAIDREGVDGCLCGGDLVGYGPMPNECVAAIAERGIPCVVGNHDLAAVGRIPSEDWIPLARRTMEWTRSVLGADAREYLAALPLTLAREGVLVAHGSLEDPERYVIGPDQAVLELARAVEREPGLRLLALGHTHRALAAGERRGLLLSDDTGTVSAPGGERVVVNPGSVGQTRHGRTRARFAVLDLGRGVVEFSALPYDVRRLRGALREAGLPSRAYNPRPSPRRWATRALGPPARLLRRLRR